MATGCGQGATSLHHLLRQGALAETLIWTKGSLKHATFAIDSSPPGSASDILCCCGLPEDVLCFLFCLGLKCVVQAIDEHEVLEHAAKKTHPNQTGDGINFASKIKGHVLAFKHTVVLCWSSICNADSWSLFLYTLPPPPLISMLWRALLFHLRNLFREKADATQSIREQNNIEIGGRGGTRRKVSQRQRQHNTKNKRTTISFYLPNKFRHQ